MLENCSFIELHPRDFCFETDRASQSPQSGLEFSPAASAPQVSGITGIHHHPWHIHCMSVWCQESNPGSHSYQTCILLLMDGPRFKQVSISCTHTHTQTPPHPHTPAEVTMKAKAWVRKGACRLSCLWKPSLRWAIPQPPPPPPPLPRLSVFRQVEVLLPPLVPMWQILNT